MANATYAVFITLYVCCIVMICYYQIAVLEPFRQSIFLTSTTTNSISMKSPPLADIFSYVHNITFEEDVTEEIEQLQQEVRIRRECKPNPDIRKDMFYTTTEHPDSVVTTISCEPVHYRIPQDSIENIDDSFVFGVLSGGSDGPARRASIHNTWGRDSPIFIIVAGNWTEMVKEEYNTHRDILKQKPESRVCVQDRRRLLR